MARKKFTRPPSTRASIQQQRARLFEAHGILQVTRYATASMLTGLDENSISNALQAASRIIDDVAAELQPSRGEKR